ncbi:MAG: phosphoribosylformylglycinamidine cyclo-ligase [Candidatus Levybacteria bacterium]|nr:phosphoribosylformylglycinamidine cyclo-ligase [Candidatus Levybacteria bacterium]
MDKRRGKKITYKSSGVNYQDLDPVKKLAQKGALKTARNLRKNGYKEISESRGESAFVWQQGNFLMASVIEGLGTKNLVADITAQITGKSYYDIIGHDTVATIINDLIAVGAKPLTISAYWAVGQSDWFKNKKRTKDLIRGWKRACNLAGVTWGGGETPTLKGIIREESIDLGGSAIGIISLKKNLITDKKLKIGDRIILLRSNGINANGLSLARALAKNLPKGYATKLPSGKIYGEALLAKTNIYAKLIQDLLNAGIDIHYISNITGHGLRKIMRARLNFTYIIEKIFNPQEIFLFIQKHANLSSYEMYQTFNMGMDYALFIPKKDIEKAQKIITKNKLESIDAGRVEEGKKQVVIKPKNIIFNAETLGVR